MYKKKKQYIIPTSLLLVNAAFFGFTNPAHISTGWLGVGLILILVTMYVLLYASIGMLKIYGVRLNRSARRHVALYATIVLGLLIALQSIGGVSGRDIAVLAPLVALGYFYVQYRKTSNRDLQT